MTTVSGVTKRKVNVPGSFERSAFFFMRLSGVFLLILAVGHVGVQHVINSVHDLTLQFVIDQWNSWGWRVYDMLLLIFALSHGINGLRNVLEDYVHNPKTMKAINGLLVVFLVVSLIGAGYAIASF